MEKIIKSLIVFVIVLFSIQNSKLILTDDLDSVHDSLQDVSMNTTRQAMTHEEIESFRKGLLDKGYSKAIIDKMILEELGYTQLELNALTPYEMNLIVNDSSDINVAIQYAKANSDGSSTLISERDYLLEVKKKMAMNENENSLDNGYNVETTTDGYMRIITIATHDSENSQPGCIAVKGIFTWLVMPKNRLTDAMTMTSNIPLLLFNEVADYSGEMTYVLTYDSGKSETHVMDGILKTNMNGFGYEFVLPNTLPTLPVHVSSLSFTLSGKFFLQQPQIETNFNIFTKYIHTTRSLSLNPRYKWGDDDMGVTLPHSFTTKGDTYVSLCLFQYLPNEY